MDANSRCSTAEDELLQIAEKVEIAYFLEARSHVEEGPYDVALVEGSITTAHDVERIREIRKQLSISRHDRSLRDSGRDSGDCATGSNVDEFIGRIRRARLHPDAGDQHSHRRSCEGRLRVARLSDQHARN